MPKFYGQNKKRIDPRYFLNEMTDEQPAPAELSPGAAKSDVLLAQTMSDFSRNVGGMGKTFHPSVMYRILRTGNISGEPGNEADGVGAAQAYAITSMGRQADELPAHVWHKLSKDLKFIKQTIDLEPGHDSGPNFQPSGDTPFREQMPS